MPPTRRRTLPLLMVATISIAGFISATTGTVAAGGNTVPVNATAEALAAFNRIRTQAGVAPLSIDPGLQQGNQEHACWMVRNDKLFHGATPNTPGYTAAADDAGQHSNIAVSSIANETATAFVDRWAAGPYHLTAMLRSNLLAVGYGQCHGDAGRWRSAGSLNVLKDLGAPVEPRPLITFPANGATTHLTEYARETVDPLRNCPGWTTAGLPLVVMLPNSPAPGTTATLVGPNGPVQVCVITQHNDRDATGRAILSYDRAVVVMPAVPLTFGTWTASVGSGAQSVNWTFNVDPDAPPPDGNPSQGPVPGPVAPARPAKLLPLTPCRLIDTREDAPGYLAPGATLNLQVSNRCAVPAQASAVSLTITSVSPTRDGHFTIHPGGAALPEVSTLNVVGGATTVRANSALSTLGANGDVNILLNAGGYVIVDVMAAFVPAASSADGRLVTMTPRRVLDTRNGGRPAPRSAVRVPLPAGVPRDAVAVAINVTTTETSNHGFFSAYPAGMPLPVASILNADARGQTRAAAAIVAVNANGFDVYSVIGDHVIVDIVGYFTGLSAPDESSGLYVADAPRRIADSRTGWGPWHPTEARNVEHGVPSASAIALNVTEVAPAAAGFLTLYPSGAALPTVSALNAARGEVAANAAIVPVGGDTFSLYALPFTHVVVDRVGWFTT